MLDSFSVWVNGQLVIQSASRLTKPWQLFCFLVLNKEKFISSRKLIATLWEDDTLADPANVLKNAVYSLRKELNGGASGTESPIIYSSGSYRFDPAVELELDLDYFNSYCDFSKRQEESSAVRMEHCREAMEVYKSDFLPQLDQELWAVPFFINNRQKYLDCVHRLCEYLWKQGKYRELLEVVNKPFQLDILDDEALVFQLRALNELKMFRVAVTTYSKVVRQYRNNVGGTPPQEARALYQLASEKVNKTEQDIMIIKADLTSGEQISRPQRGAYFCHYSDFHQVYALLKRASERNCQMLVLALFTLTPLQKSDIQPNDLARAMAEFKVVSMNTLRKADSFARYSQNQYSVLLSVSSLEAGRLVRDRICDSFSKTPAARQFGLEAKMAEV